MKKAIKEFISKAIPRQSDEFIDFWIIDSEKPYNGSFGKNGYNNIILIGRAKRTSEDAVKPYELITDYSDVVCFFEGCGGFSIDIDHKLGAIHLWTDKPVKIPGSVMSAVMFEGTK